MSVPDIDPDCALFLDVDGTLAEIAADRDAVSLDASMRNLIQRLRDGLGGALALVSGRRLDDIDRMTSGLAVAVAAEHGAELRRADASLRRPAAPAGWGGMLSDLRDAVALMPGLDLEEKGASLALHYRAAPGLAGAARDLAEQAVARLDGDYGLRDGKMVVEIAPRGIDKGDAIARLLRERPFSDRRPVFVGDDVTDEDGFRRVNERGGISVKVGPGATVAGFRLDDVAAVTDWLTRQARRLETSSTSSGSAS